MLEYKEKQYIKASVQVGSSNRKVENPPRFDASVLGLILVY